jgi:hypothetical protein
MQDRRLILLLTVPLSLSTMPRRLACRTAAREFQSQGDWGAPCGRPGDSPNALARGPHPLRQNLCFHALCMDILSYTIDFFMDESLSCFVFSNFSALGNEKRRSGPFVFKMFPALGASRKRGRRPVKSGGRSGGGNSIISSLPA